MKSSHLNVPSFIFHAAVIRTCSHARDPNVARDINVAVLAHHLLFAFSVLRSDNGIALRLRGMLVAEGLATKSSREGSTAECACRAGTLGSMTEDAHERLT